MWAKPAGDGFVLYLPEGGTWKPMKIVDDNSTSVTSDDLAESAGEIKKSLVGKATDAKTTNTIHGAKNYAADAATTAKNEVIGSAQDTAEDMTLFGLKAYVDAQIENLG